jgi:hypothetical protein
VGTGGLRPGPYPLEVLGLIHLKPGASASIRKYGGNVYTYSWAQDARERIPWHSSKVHQIIMVCFQIDKL